MAAISVVATTLEAGEAVQWQNSTASLTDITTLVGAGKVRRISDEHSNVAIEVFLGGVWQTVRLLDWVFVGETTDTRIMSNEEYVRYYEPA